MSFHTLPYDLLFNIAQYLTTDDVCNLQATCKSLRTFTLTRPVYRSLAHALLARSRPLPLPAFQRLADLSTQNLIKAVDRANKFEKAWRVRAPRPARSSFSLSASGSTSSEGQHQWYTKISAPPNEEIDWLSPITSSYTLCATKSGRVICWDVARDVCLAEWDPRTLAAHYGSGERVPKDSVKGNRSRIAEDDDEEDEEDEETNSEKKWELWKCRVEFDERAVYFTMARVLEGSYDDDRVMEFVLMKLAFPPDPRDYRTPAASPLLRSSSFTPESHCCSLPKSPPTSLPPSQRSSPLDPTRYSSGAVTDCMTTIFPPSPVMLGRTISPSPDHTESDREALSRNTLCPCPASSLCPVFPANRCMLATTGTRASLRPTFTAECAPMEPTLEPKPFFFPLTSFHTTGVVMNVFLLDPPRRLLSAFVWVARSNTIGLYVLLDWEQHEYVFVDTGVGCLISSNWSCILHEDQIVIHSEEAEAAYQHFYPLNTLRNFSKPRRPSFIVPHMSDIDHEPVSYEPPSKLCQDDLPVISARLAPVRSISKKFVFPDVAPGTVPDVGLSNVTVEYVGAAAGEGVDDDEAHESSPDIGSGQPDEGPLSSVVSVGNLEGETDEGEISVDDECSEYETGEEGVLPQEAAEGISRAKGKARAEENDVDEEPDLPTPGPSTSAKGKGKLKEVDVEEHGEDESRPGPSSYTLNVSPPSAQNVLDALQSLPVIVGVSNNITAPPETLVEPAPNPYPFPPWYPESAHFVRQWWPTLPGVPRLSCTVVLLAAHDPNTHRTRFVLAQHYFRVPIVQDPPSSNSASPNSNSNENRDDDEMLHLWYVSTPFEVVCVLDSATENGHEDDTGDRPRPLVAVDFGHAVWVEYAAEPGGVYGVDASRLVGDPSLVDSDDEVEDDAELSDGLSDDEDDDDEDDEGSGSGTTRAPGGNNASTNPHDGDGTIFDPRRHRVPKCLRFVTFPPVFTAVNDGRNKTRRAREEAVVRTLEIPDELDLDGVETINIDQSQGAVILSVKEGNIFILRYE